MLIKPNPLSVAPTSVVVLHQNEFFQLILVKPRRSILSLGLFSTKETYYITLLVSRFDATAGHYLAIAQSDALKDIESEWNFIIKSIYPNLSVADDRREEQLAFLEQKFFLDAQHTEEQVIRNENILEFHALFPTIPGESCILDYPTVLWKGTTISKGRIYLTSHFICFAPDRGAERLCLAWAHIISITRDGLISFANPLKILTDDGKTYHFSLVIRPDEVVDVLQELWHLALDEVVLKEEQIMRSMELIFNTVPNTPTARARRLSFSSPTGDIPVTPKAQPQNRQVTKLASAEELVNVSKNRNFQRKFRLPDLEKLQMTWTGCLFRTSTNESGKGTVALSKHFVCVSDDSNLQKVVVALVEVTEITVTLDQGEPAICIRTRRFELFIRAETKGDLLADMVHQFTINWKVATFNHSKGKTSAQRFFDENGKCQENVNLLRKINDSLEPESTRNAARWNQFFEIRGCSFTLVRNSDFRALVRSGVPDEMRGYVWQLSSGSIYLRMLLESDGYYSSLVSWSASHHSIATDEIERDLNRSLPEHPFYKTPEGISSLRRVLHAYSWHNPALGYCQAMNIVVATLLLFTSEESAFYLLCSICEVILPGSYSRALIGAQIDQAIFEGMLNARLPDLAAHIKKTNTPLSAITLPWAISLFIGYLPLRAVLRILDWFFLRGIETLIQASLSVLYLSKEKILAHDDGYIIATILKDCMWINPDKLLHTMFTVFGDIQLHDVEILRRQHRIQAIMELQKSNRHSQISDLEEKTKFSVSELENMYTLFKKATIANAGSVGDTVDFAQLSEFVASLGIAWWQRIKQDNQLKIVKQIKSKDVVDNVPRLGFHPLMVGLWPWMNGDLNVRFSLCFEAYDEDKDGRLNADQLAGCLDLLTRILHHAPKGDVTVFVLMLFDKVEVPQSGLLTKDQVKQEVIDKPLFVEFFGIA